MKKQELSEQLQLSKHRKMQKMSLSTNWKKLKGNCKKVKFANGKKECHFVTNMLLVHDQLLSLNALETNKDDCTQIMFVSGVHTLLRNLMPQRL